MKVLYVGYILVGDNSATGVTLENIFSNENREILLMQCCLDYNMQRHSEKVATVCVDRFKSLMYYATKSLFRIFSEKNHKQSINITKMVSGHKKNAIVSLVQAFIDILPKRYSASSTNIIASFTPDIIYTLGENISTLQLSKDLSEKYRIPIVLHIMDDIESNIYKESSILKPFRNRYNRLLDNVYLNNKVHLAIGEKMSKEYQLRHGAKFDFVMNCVHKINNKPHINNSPLRIVFSGGLHGGRDRSLLLLAQLIKSNKTYDSKFEIYVYTSKADMEINQDLKSYCKLCEYVPKEKIIDNLSKADILLHVESFDVEEIDYFKYSMSTKIPEYLAIGRPILVFGPSEIGSVDYVKKHNVGCVAENIHGLENALVLLSNKSQRDMFSENALSLAKNEHMDKSVQKKLLSTFVSAKSSYLCQK